MKKVYRRVYGRVYGRTIRMWINNSEFPVIISQMYARGPVFLKVTFNKLSRHKNDHEILNANLQAVDEMQT